MFLTIAGFPSFTKFLLCFVDEITASFRRFGPLVVDWPHKAESKSYFPPKGNGLKMSLCLSDARQYQIRWSSKS